TPQAVTDSGVFLVHRVGENYFYEIPQKMLGREFLWISDQRGTIEGLRYAGEQLSQREMKWERVGNRILLKILSYRNRADSTLPVNRAVQLSNESPILMSFDVAAWGPDSNAVIDVNRLFLTDVAEINLHQDRTVRLRRFDPARSYIEKIRSFPQNIEVMAYQTFEVDSVPSAGGRAGGGGRGLDLNTITMYMNYSMVLLPEKPMMPRLCDGRIGFFSTRFTDYGADKPSVPTRCYIDRWRLEPKNPGAAVSDPVKPIVFYVDPATPTKWVPWLIKGIEAWEPVFRAAGFSNAIKARTIPTPQEDPQFDLDDVRYSTVRWLPSTTENAYGPHVSDPRTGEILQSNIGFYHNVVELAESWYWVQAGAADPRIKRVTLPLPDSILGPLVAYVITHEVGHTLGLPHNQGSSGRYPTDSLRSPTYTRANGTSYSIMDYARNNYVAQPGDNVLLSPKIGPWDFYTINWGYRLIKGAASPEAERPLLDSLARLQDRHPEFQFGDDGDDPRTQSETLGDDPVKAATFGVANIKRLMPMIMPATTADKLDTYGDMASLYNNVVGQWGREINGVAQVVGGVYHTDKYPGQAGPVYTPVPRERQAAAVKFLNDNVFQTPMYLLDPQIQRLTENEGSLSRIRARQDAVLTTILNDDKLARLADQAATATAADPAYTLADLFGDLRHGIFSELADTSRVTVDAYRRNMQRALVEQLDRLVNGTSAAGGAGGRGGRGGASPRPADARALARLELKDLETMVSNAVPHASDRMTQAHLEDLKADIQKALDKTPSEGGAAAGGGRGGRRGAAGGEGGYHR
ncbi:MAG TPA: zinc-dependent metalloprotease, partial [Gemmatimonadales bacterium]